MVYFTCTFDFLFQSHHLWSMLKIKMSQKATMWKSTVMWLQVFLIQLLCGQMSRLVNTSRETHWTSLTSTELKLENTGALQIILVEWTLQWWTLMFNVRTQLDLFTWIFSWKGLIRRVEGRSCEYIFNTTRIFCILIYTMPVYW